MYDEIVSMIAHLEEPYLFLWLLPLILLVYYVIMKSHIGYTDTPKKEKELFFISRALIIFFLFIALATPFVVDRETIEFEPGVTVLVDQSASMDLYSENKINRVISYFTGEKGVELKTVYLETENSTALGNKILEVLEPNMNVILYTDGQVTEGASLGDIVVQAIGINASLYAIELDQNNDDSWILIEGYEKVLDNVESSFTVKVKSTSVDKSGNVKVSIDGEELFNGEINGNYSFGTSLGLGMHIIEAEIVGEDFFEENNKFYKVVHAISKPEVLLVGESNSPLYDLLNIYYDVKVDSSLGSLDDYYAVIIDNQDANSMDSKTQKLSEFVGEGNGLFVVGGENAFNTGGYEESMFETILPVYISEPEKEEGDMNIVVLIDISGSTGTSVNGIATVDIEKALAIDIINDLSLEHNVGIIAFHSTPYSLYGIRPLKEQVDVANTIASLQFGGGTSVEGAIERAITMLEYKKGNKNIILISDGVTQSPSEAEKMARRASSKGIKIFTVGVGDHSYEKLLGSLASIGGGIYFPADQSSNIEIIFGPPEEFEGDEAGIKVLDQNHFITKDLEIDAGLVYKNSFTQKDSGRLLVTSNTGSPVLVVGRYGLGRVAAFAGDNGRMYSPGIYQGENSELLTRTVNWAIGNPTRKQEGYIEVEDVFLGEAAFIVIEADEIPEVPGLEFEKTKEDTYEAIVIPEKEGIYSILDSGFAVNYPEEYAKLGVSNRVSTAVENTAGKLFKVEELEDLKEELVARAKKDILKRNSIAYYFAALALIIYVIEICARRILKIY